MTITEHGAGLRPFPVVERRTLANDEMRAVGARGQLAPAWDEVRARRGGAALVVASVFGAAAGSSGAAGA
jgi:hypothetical protein